MLVVSTIILSEEMQMHIERAFPDITFIYEEKWVDEQLSQAEILINENDEK